MIKLSAVIITYNEEKNIERCLISLKDVVDEIVVVDSFSVDNTKEICLKYGVKFFENKFEGHIQQKNKAITFASNNHVLSLDADEALDNQLAESIKEIKNNFKYDGYYMNRLTNYCGKWIKHCGWYPDRKLRLWDRRKGEWKGMNPHDKYELFAGNENTGFLRGDILHYSYYTLNDHYRQVEYFTDISAQANYDKGNRAAMYKLMINPIAKFIDHYILHLGFLDGKEGFLISKISAYATFLKYKKLREKYYKKSKK